MSIVKLIIIDNPKLNRVSKNNKNAKNNGDDFVKV
jgi:hypothetical protein